MSLELIKDLGYLYPNETSKQKRRYGIFLCSCGVELTTQIYGVKSGKTNSCGCYQIEIATKCNTTHGFRNHRLYKVWKSMIHRCINKKNKDYDNYGGRGITVCDRWLDVKNFIEDMYSTYKEGLSIDRIDVNGNYCKENCRWATKNVQARNTRILKSTNTSGYRGVHFEKRTSKWIARIKTDNKRIHLGTFKNAVDGAIAYNKYVLDNNLEHTLNELSKH